MHGANASGSKWVFSVGTWEVSVRRTGQVLGRVRAIDRGQAVRKGANKWRRAADALDARDILPTVYYVDDPTPPQAKTDALQQKLVELMACDRWIWALAWTGSRKTGESVEDVRQELFLEIVRRAKWFDPRRAGACKFLKLIFRTVLTRLFALKRRRPKLFAKDTPVLADWTAPPWRIASQREELAVRR